MLNQIFNSQTKTITFAAILLGLSALVSRILGLFRDRLLAGQFGAGPELDIYFASFQIPDLIFGIFIIGGIGAVFLPLFAEYFERDPKKGWEFTNQALNCFLILLIFICGILIIFTPWLINLVTPGFSQEQKAWAISLTRIMFLSPIFFGLSSIFSGILQYFNRFLIYSLAPILYNLGIIFGILVLVPPFYLWGLIYGVIFGAFLHWLIQIPAARNLGYFWSPYFNFKHPGLIKAFRLMIPRAISRLFYHLNFIVVTAIASTLVTGSITVFNFANNLQAFPVGLIGVPFALASFPVLSRAWAKRDKEKFLEDFSSVFRQILFLIIPIILLIFLLRIQIVRLILGTGQFGWWETRLTAASLGLFCLGIFSTSFIPLLFRTFFSLQDTKTPAFIGVASMVLNIALCFIFLWVFSFPNFFREFILNFLKIKGIEGVTIITLPLAVSLSMTTEFSLLLFFFYKKIGDIRLGEILDSLKRIFLASIFLVISTYFTLRIVACFVDMQTFFGILIQASLAALIGIFVYILIALLLKSPEFKTICFSIMRQFKPR